MSDAIGIDMAVVLVAAMFLLLGAGLWVGLSLLAVGVIGIMLFSTRPAGDAMATTIWSSLTSWTLTPLPLFIWMGEILHRSRVAESLIRALEPWVRRVPGRLLHVNVLGCTIFAAISGSSAATCATVGRITVPELRKRRYSETMVVGSLVGSASLGLLIPPSIIMIVYGVAANVSITKLFVAGVLPGLLLAAVFAAYVAFVGVLRPSGERGQAPASGLGEVVARSLGLVPPAALILAVLGAVYTGVATATQAAAIGVVGALVISALQGRLAPAVFWESLMSAARTSAMILLILGGSSVLTLSMGFTGLPRDLAAWIGGLGLSQAELLVAFTLFFVVLGCFLDGISVVVLTMAILLPVIHTAQFDLLWFGIYMVIVVEMAQITPPIGFNLFVAQGLTGHEIGFVSRAAFPFFLLMVGVVAVLYFVPEIVLMLPAAMEPRG